MFNLLMKSNRKRAKRRGFTLIELVIVIVILGILAGVAALSFQNVTQSSRNGVAKANLRALKSAAQVYQADKSGKLPENLFDLKPYLENDLQKATGIDTLTTAGNPPAVDGFTFSMTHTAASGTAAAFIELKVVGNGLTGVETDNDGSYYKITGLK